MDTVSGSWGSRSSVNAELELIAVMISSAVAVDLAVDSISSSWGSRSSIDAELEFIAVVVGSAVGVDEAMDSVSLCDDFLARSRRANEADAELVAVMMIIAGSVVETRSASGEGLSLGRSGINADSKLKALHARRADGVVVLFTAVNCFGHWLVESVLLGLGVDAVLELVALKALAARAGDAAGKRLGLGEQGLQAEEGLHVEASGGGADNNQGKGGVDEVFHFVCS